ncbi:MAG: hypothetical protein AAB759_01520 [Patescibacteria group bacterium]
MTRRFLVLFGGAAFLWAAFFGVVFAADGHGGITMPCPLMKEGATMCPVALLTHIANWQKSFAATPETVVSLFTVTILFFAIALVRPEIVALSAGTPFRHRLRGVELSLYDRFRAALRAGVLHARVYA